MTAAGEAFPIGTPGVPWGEDETQAWFATQSVQRSYADDVLAALAELDPTFEHHHYGALPLDPERYPLYAVEVRSARPDAPWALITGGVHGYETSGVHGALEVLRSVVPEIRDELNLLVAPCVSPWGYEVIHRWNPDAVDPNRSFVADGPSPEANALMALVASFDVEWLVHMDLHETTDTDETEFRPALAARDGKPYRPDTIPDGFYTVGDTENPQAAFQAAVIAGVEAVTHIAPPDEHGQIIGSDVTQHGVIEYPLRELALCAGMTDARFTTTTEVYPDSPNATPAICIDAQVAAVRAGLRFAIDAGGG